MKIISIDEKVDLYGRYILNSKGDIYSKHIKRNLKKLEDPNGYYYYRLVNNVGNTEHWFLHKLIATHYIENTDNKPIVNHKDGNKKNNGIDNLEWSTYYENNKHARDNNLNNISLSNSTRWEDKDFRERTSKNISKGILKAGSNKGRNNPRANVCLKYNGKEYMLSELGKELGVRPSYMTKIRKLLEKGEENTFIQKHEITYIKGKVNRLSKG